MSTVKEILDEKGRDVLSIAPEATVYAAIASMSEHGIGALVVLDAGKLVGIITERDYARKVILEGRSSRDCQVGEVMTRRVLCVSPERTVAECMALMTDKRARHLPVVEQDAVIGLVSIGDAVKAVISEQQFTIEQLEQYISG